MDWLEEKIEKTARHIRNLSFRKAMIAYILVLAAIVFILSYLTMVLCWQWEIAEWANHEREDFVEVIYKKGPLWGTDYTFEALPQQKAVASGFCAGVVSIFLRICRNGRDDLHFLSKTAGVAS